MTHPEARRRAVEAACVALSSAVGCDEPECGACQQAGKDAITAYERAMADAGWRMVRVPDAKEKPATDIEWLSPREVAVQLLGIWEGWNACRAKMLEDEV